MNILHSITRCGRILGVKSYIDISSRLSSSRPLVSVVEDEKSRSAKLVMQKTPVNSLNLEMLEALTSSIKNLEKKDYKGFILSSSCPTVYSSGLDLMELYQPEEKRFRAFWKSLQEMWKTLYITPLVTIAAVNGHAPAGGCLLTLSCDYRIMITGMGTIGMNETKLGISAPRWFQSLLVETIGYRVAERGLYSGALFTAEQALKLNIVDELVNSTEELEAMAEKHLGIWLKIPDAARRVTKSMLRKKAIDELDSYADQEIDEIYKFVCTDSMQKPLAKYLENLKAKKKS